MRVLDVVLDELLTAEGPLEDDEAPDEPTAGGRARAAISGPVAH